MLAGACAAESFSSASLGSPVVSFIISVRTSPKLTSPIQTSSLKLRSLPQLLSHWGSHRQRVLCLFFQCPSDLLLCAPNLTNDPCPIPARCPDQKVQSRLGITSLSPIPHPTSEEVLFSPPLYLPNLLQTFHTSFHCKSSQCQWAFLPCF